MIICGNCTGSPMRLCGGVPPFQFFLRMGIILELFSKYCLPVLWDLEGLITGSFGLSPQWRFTIQLQDKPTESSVALGVCFRGVPLSVSGHEHPLGDKILMGINHCSIAESVGDVPQSFDPVATQAGFGAVLETMLPPGAWFLAGMQGEACCVCWVVVVVVVTMV